MPTKKYSIDLKKRLANKRYAKLFLKTAIRGSNPVHVVSPATVSQIREVLGIKDIHVKRVLQAFAEAGVKI